MIPPVQVFLEHLTVRERLEALRADVSARNSEAKIIAVTKGFGSEVVDIAYKAGHREFGESYAQELLTRETAFGDGAIHFLGRIQRNKVRKIAHLVTLWHSVGREEVIDEIAKRAPGASILLQVLAEGDETKQGFRANDVEEQLVRATSLGLKVDGLMTIGVYQNREATHEAFQACAKLGRSLGVSELSMGMSQDYDLGIAEGATMIRVGSTLFGSR